MTIKFTSFIKQGDKKDKIEFTSPVEISEWNNFKVYEFKEPQLGEQNRIEIKDDEINIFAGRNTFHLKLGESVNIDYQSGNQIFTMTSFLDNLKRKEKEESFKYILSQNKTIIGEYSIVLLIND